MPTPTRPPVIVASKRAPVEYGYSEHGELVSSISPGGTASVIADQASYLGVTWLASAMSEADKALARQHPGGTQITVGEDTSIWLRLLVHEPDVFDLVQYYFVNEVLWLSQHGLHNRWAEPDYTERTRAAWGAFVAFNEDYARELLRTASEAGVSSFLVHDFQLMYAPQIIRSHAPASRILSFSHSAWPSSGEWQIVPKYMRAPLITAALNADVIGFFARRWVTNFLDCVRDMVPDAQIDWKNSLVHRAGRVTEVRSMPLGYSPRSLAARAADLPGELAGWIDDATLVVHSGRTDPIKNAGRAIDIFATTAAGSAGTKMAVKMNPNRLYVPANQQYLDDARRRADQANQKLGYEAVRVLATNDVGITLGLLRRADVLFLNSVIDGMNLTAFEGVMVNERNCAVVLSENCGAAEVLGAVSITVCPFDVDEQCRALRTALDASPAERAESFVRLRDTAAPYTLERWVDQQWERLSGESDG